MSLLLCRQRAERPLCHDKLNINIWSEQELCYIIYNYPLLCIGDFCGERLFDWIENELHIKPLAERLKANFKAGEISENQLLLILQECNYYDINEVVDFGKRIAAFRKCAAYELINMEGRALYRAGNFNAAYEKFEQSVKELENQYKKSAGQDDAVLRNHNEKKADIYCDMAALKMQMFDEKAASELVAASLMTCKNRRAAELKYLIDGSGDIPDERKAELDGKKAEIEKNVRQSRAYKAVEDIFKKDKASAFREARKLAAEWKSSYRRM